MYFFILSCSFIPFPNGARFSSLEKWFYSIPKLFIILFWLVSTLLTLSRTAVFTSLIVVFSIYILPHILRIRVTCSFPYPLLKLRKSFLLKSIGVGTLAIFFVNRFYSFFEVALAFFNPESSSKVYNSGVGSIFLMTLRKGSLCLTKELLIFQD